MKGLSENDKWTVLATIVDQQDKATRTKIAKDNGFYSYYYLKCKMLNRRTGSHVRSMTDRDYRMMRDYLVEKGICNLSLDVLKMDHRECLEKVDEFILQD